MAKTGAFDLYLANLPADKRTALEKVRRAIHAAAPQAEECLCYGLPAFRDGGKVIAAMAARMNHCAYYPMSGSIIAALAAELDDYDTSQGTVRFDAAKPLPAALVRKLVKARQEEIAAAAAERAAKRAKAGSEKKAAIRATAARGKIAKKA